MGAKVASGLPCDSDSKEPASNAVHPLEAGGLGWEDPLEKGMTTHSTPAWRIPPTEEPGGLQSMGSKEVDVLSDSHFHFFTAVADILRSQMTLIVASPILGQKNKTKQKPT